MNNLYVFAIGGSGERVMRSFIMLMAAGVKLGANKVVPIFVDNDANSQALTRCKDLIRYYNAQSAKGGKMGIGTVCHQYAPDKRASFFQTDIEEPITLDIAGDTIGDLKSIIGSGLNIDDPIQKAIIEERDLLFSDDDLSMKLTVGFVGNPNIGSVVLNTLSFTDPKFADVLANAGPNDGVMVIGSLFGGTGAAGFPLIVNSFNRMDAAGNIDTSRPAIGGVAILPYFEFGTQDKYAAHEQIIDTNKWDVNSDTFSTKTRAALMYYDEYMKGMDFLYYVGDDNRAMYEHYVGGAKQDNPVHLVELLGAMSIVDFSKQAKQDNIVYKEPVWGIDEDQANNPTICNVSSVRNTEIKRALVKFQLMREFFINQNDGFLKHGIANFAPYAKDIAFTEEMRQACTGADPSKTHRDLTVLGPQIDSETKNFPYAWGLNAFFKEWVSWCADLSGQSARRHLNIFPNAVNDIDENNVTFRFFADGDKGIAKIVKKKPLFGKEKEVPLYPELATKIQAAHRRLNFSTLSEDKKLAALLKTISDGLDDVIDQNCAL